MVTGGVVGLVTLNPIACPRLCSRAGDSTPGSNEYYVVTSNLGKRVAMCEFASKCYSRVLSQIRSWIGRTVRY